MALQQPTATTINDYFMRYYYAYRHHSYSNLSKHVKLDDFLSHFWSCGITYEQAILDAMELGFSMCVVIPQVQRVYAWWDADYAAYQARCYAANKLDVETL